MAYLAAHGMRCIAFDRRGHGRSAETTGGYDYDTLADDVDAIMEHLDLRGAALVGQSMGCGEVVRYLSRHGAGRVSRLVMIATSTPFVLKTGSNPDGVDAASLERVRTALSTDRPSAIAGAAPSFFGTPTNHVSDEMMNWWTTMLRQCPLRVMLDLHHALTETDFRAELSAISLPTLLIHGDRDVSAPIGLTGRKTASLIRGSQFKVYEDAAHGLPITHMHRLNSELQAFLS